jgi:hypothetical protein
MSTDGMSSIAFSKLCIRCFRDLFSVSSDTSLVRSLLICASLTSQNGQLYGVLFVDLRVGSCGCLLGCLGVSLGRFRRGCLGVRDGNFTTTVVLL